MKEHATSRDEEYLGWYWSEKDPDLYGQTSLNGPFSDQEAAISAASIAGHDNAHTGQWQRKEISCDVFRARQIFAQMDLLNVEAIVPGQPVHWPSGADAEELELRLAALLCEFMEERKVWTQFTGLERSQPIGPA